MFFKNIQFSIITMLLKLKNIKQSLSNMFYYFFVLNNKKQLSNNPKSYFLVKYIARSNY